jgi:hypothetical protein
MRPTIFSFVAKLLSYMRGDQWRKRKYSARNKLETSSTMGVLGETPPSRPPQTAQCYKLMNEKLGEISFSVINT